MGREVYLLKIKENKQKKAIAGILRQIADKVEHVNLTMKQETGTFVVDFLEDMTHGKQGEERKETKIKMFF